MDTPFEQTHRPGASSRLALAHYFTPYPISIDNKPPASDYYTTGYLNPLGESGAHKAYGGLLRDRPIPRDIRPSGWELDDMRIEIRQAIEAGLDGFTLDLLNVSDGNYNWDRSKRMLTAASEVDGFKIVLMPDMTTLTAAKGHSAVSLAARIKILASYKAAHRLADGRLVIAPFKSEDRSPAFWADLANELKKLGVTIVYVFCFNDWRKNIPLYRDLAYGFAAWGERNPSGYNNMVEAGKLAHSYGKLWMAPVAFQDVRPSQKRYWEARGTETLRATWKAAIDCEAEWVQITTWNDYYESSSVAPSVNHGYAPLVVSAYYAECWKTGAAPKLTRDAVVVSSRTHFVTTKPSSQTDLAVLQAGTGTPAADIVEVLVFAVRPAQVVVRTGATVQTTTVQAGVTPLLVSLALGEISAAVVRSGAITAEAKLPKPVIANPTVQDLSYQAAVSVGKVADPLAEAEARIALLEAEAVSLKDEIAGLELLNRDLSEQLTRCIGTVERLEALRDSIHDQTRA